MFWRKKDDDHNNLKSQAYRRGYDSRNLHKNSQMSNPYNKELEPKKWFAWLYGWIDANNGEKDD